MHVIAEALFTSLDLTGADTLEDWSVDQIRELTRLLHALTAGETPR